MSERFVNFRAFLVATLCLHVNTIDVTTTWLNDTIIGTTATLQCSWTVASGEIPAALLYSPTNNTDPFYFSCVVNTDPPYSCAKGSSAQNRHNSSSSQRGSVSMLITNLNCSDDGTSYFCFVGEAFKTPNISQAPLRIKVRPTAPTLSNVQTDVQENSNITATCTAGVGYPNAGQIVWKANQNGQSVDLLSKLMITAVNVTKSGDDKCTVRTQSSVTLKVNRLHQNFSLACFVINQIYKPTAPENCINTATDLCAMTNPVIVTYPVSSISVTREPVTTLYEGARVTLKCQADGNPLPTYTWTKVGDENRTPFSVMDGLVSTVTLTSLNKSLDAGDYNCSASNVVKNMMYKASGLITLTIYEATKPAPTTTTTVKTTKTTTKQMYGSTQSTGLQSIENNNPASDSESNAVSIIAISVILSAIIIVQFVVILVLCRRNKASNGLCKPKLAERKPHTYDRAEEKESHYDYINDSYYKSIEI
uniref:Ig-like domain-containing protein n=1 Tax=Biomphalaria glabrata TaxID=6526 RepID=A0A2C9LUF7_BIOGL